MFIISDRVSFSLGKASLGITLELQGRNNGRMSFKLVLVCALFCTSVFPASGLVFTPNSLASKLRELAVPDWDVPSIVCLAHNASNLNTGFVSHRSDIDYNYYGIFGIPDKLFDHKPCKHMTRALAVDNDINDDVRCLMNMIKDGGYFRGNRTESIQVFTPHDVDLAKCFDWFASLPPYISANGTGNDTDKSVVAADDKTDATDRTVDSRVVCSGAGVMTNFLLFGLNLALIGLCLVGYLVLKQLRVNYAVAKFNDNALL